MGRRERPVDPEAGPIQLFALELREIREKAGNPTYLRMARASGRSRTALAEAAGGDHLPTWETVESYVSACGEDPRAWLKRWEVVREEIRRDSSESVQPRRRPASPAASDSAYAGDGEGSQSSDEELNGQIRNAESAPVSSRRGMYRRLAATALVVAVLSVAATMAAIWLSRPAWAQRADNAALGAAVEVQVQNMVAIGPTQLMEDSTPAYLSSEPVPYCAENGCEVAGTQMWSGSWIMATCQLTGARMTNEDLSSSGIGSNPNGVISSTWYEAEAQRGETGYISEVYIAPHDRGLGLPPCSNAAVG